VIAVAETDTDEAAEQTVRDALGNDAEDFEIDAV
jgi:hypothetical protein